MSIVATREQLILLNTHQKIIRSHPLKLAVWCSLTNVSLLVVEPMLLTIWNRELQ